MSRHDSGRCLFHRIPFLGVQDFRLDLKLISADDNALDHGLAVRSSVLRRPRIRRHLGRHLGQACLRVKELMREQLGRFGSLLGVVTEHQLHEFNGFR